VENKEQAFKLINKLELARNLSNLGDLRTLVVHPESTIYHSLSKDEQQQLGVNPALIRVSVGIENPDDIILDFKEALAAL
jgi:O-acetylhomoserine (thiol)-lyase